jgi:hypothetical protein
MKLICLLVVLGSLATSLGCLLPFCTETTTTTTDIITIAEITSRTTTLTISQPIVICISNLNSTVTDFTSTCTTSCTTVNPSSRFQVCKYQNGPYRVIFNTLTFVSALEACESFGWQPADLNFENFNEAVGVATNCLGQGRRVWIRTYEGEAKPCLAVNTGEEKSAIAPFIEIIPCDLHYPIICKIPPQK